MRIEKCWFCSANIYPGKGTVFVRGDSTVFNFCRSKCHKLFKLRKNPRKVKWTKISRILRGKDVVDDRIAQFERRMDEPMMYNRARMAQVVEAIPLVIEKKQQIDRAATVDRIMKAKEQSKMHDLAFMTKNERLLQNDYEKLRRRIVKKKAEKRTEPMLN
ncbi:RLP24 [Enterospora canceri]|uniref:RLP24 n=1 Tax=Enterospora canceri TaxID=1081671 RepID=A0A1Y1S8E9_9MICR|nr:RLP24 [Enterospora canceri]